ncbi:MAG: hypothetical protein LQ343_000310 [Gyalolechia ehrenbergii]|nr:MAG: hypothetical protein LQ343_000310 [Gyalolechia ehrenbergii]
MKVDNITCNLLTSDSSFKPLTMSGKRLLDVAALYQATRAVVSKHVALRTYQLEAYKKTSSLVKAIATRTGRVTLTKNAAFALGGRVQSSSNDYSIQASSDNARKQASQVPSRESVQTPESTSIKKQGLRQDHFYERSEQNTTAQPPPVNEIRVQQESAKRYPLPDGSIPPAESKLTASAHAKESFSQLPRTESEINPLTEITEQPDENLEPSSSDKSRIPDPSKGTTLPSPENARRLQRQAEEQIPSQAAETPTATPSDVNAARNDQGETTELGTDQNRDVFYTPSPKAGQVLSALPRVKLRTNTVDKQHSVESVPDGHTNPDIFYSSQPNGQELALPRKQAIPQQDEPSKDMYSELFHSPKVAKLLKGNPKPADSSQGLNLKGVKETPIEDDRSIPVGDPETFNTRATRNTQIEKTEDPAYQEHSTLSKPSREDDVETLAADIAKDASWEVGSTSADKSDVPPTVPLDMHESRVPSSRLGRLWQYGGLATSMAFGAVGESFRRVTGSSQNSGGSLMLSASNMERLVAKLSRMRGAALKLGQMMSFQDSKMLPAPIYEVLQRVQDSADYMPASQRNQVLASNLGSDWRQLFSSFEERPIAAASIGQVHSATMRSTGTRVAVKVQYPGVANSIDSDLDNLAILLTASRLLPKGLYLDKTIANARTELAWECDYVREAESGRRFQKLLQGERETFVVPSVVDEASGPQVLTAELMEGIGVTKVQNLTQEQKDWIGSHILRLCLREITEFKFMQTDPNWTNFLYNSKASKLELLDFGASREYPDKFIVPYVQILQAASRNDRDTIRDRSIELGYLTGHESQAMLNAHVTSVLTLAEPFSDSSPKIYDFRDQTITDRVRGLIPLMVRERLAPPPEETYSLHRKLSGAFLLCARLGSRVRCRELFANAMTKANV